MRIACHTLGCKVNQYDTEAMLELFEKAGYESVSMNEEADVYLINTCTVTGTGASKSLKMISSFAVSFKVMPIQRPPFMRNGRPRQAS